MSAWDDDERRALERFAFARGVRVTAREIGCTHQSVYNWIQGDTQPMPVFQARVREIVSRLGMDPRD